MAFEGGIHRAIELCELTRVFAEEMWAQFVQSGAHTIRVGWQINRAKRTHLAVAHKPGVSLDANNGSVENRSRFSTAPLFASRLTPGLWATARCVRLARFICQPTRMVCAPDCTNWAHISSAKTRVNSQSSIARWMPPSKAIHM